MIIIISVTLVIISSIILNLLPYFIQKERRYTKYSSLSTHQIMTKSNLVDVKTAKVRLARKINNKNDLNELMDKFSKVKIDKITTYYSDTIPSIFGKNVNVHAAMVEIDNIPYIFKKQNLWYEWNDFMCSIAKNSDSFNLFNVNQGTFISSNWFNSSVANAVGIPLTMLMGTCTPPPSYVAAAVYSPSS